MKKKILVTLSVIACALLLVVGSVAGTLAYLTSKTETVTNTFTAGNVEIAMVESVVDLYGTPTSGTTSTGNQYKLIPGHTYTKNPTITVKADSEDCYLFVKVVNGISEIETGTIATQLDANGWTLLSGDVWYHAVVNSSDTAQDIPTFGTFTIKGDANVAGYVTTGNAAAKIEVTAYAVQADGFANAEAAWNATFGN